MVRRVSVDAEEGNDAKVKLIRQWRTREKRRRLAPKLPGPGRNDGMCCMINWVEEDTAEGWAVQRPKAPSLRYLNDLSNTLCDKQLHQLPTLTKRLDFRQETMHARILIQISSYSQPHGSHKWSHPLQNRSQVPYYQGSFPSVGQRVVLFKLRSHGFRGLVPVQLSA